jgi:hypothetical protein
MGRSREGADRGDVLPLDTATFRRNGDLARMPVGGKITWKSGSGPSLLSRSYGLRHAGPDKATLWLGYLGGTDGAPSFVREQISLIATRPNYGGRRWWFACPACRRRVRRLFMPRSGGEFRCRICHHLAYESSQLSHTRLEAFGRFLRLQEACRRLALDAC